jgi:predicted glycoside hydrolase/deacetylase ChbG (UPF0249 family)
MKALEKLGFATGKTVAVVHADDIGMSHSANAGAFEALANGPATCGSVMVPCPWFAEAAQWAQDGRDLDLGVHLTLNAEYDGFKWGPTAGRTLVPSLVDESGYLYATSRDTVKYGSVEDVETELRAQIDTALDAGIDVTHLDSHMGTVFHPKFFDVYLSLARQYRLPLFLPRAVSGEPPVDDELPADDALGAMEEEGFPIFDSYCADSLSFEPGEGRPHNERRLRDLSPGLNYLICHPAQGGDELSAITDTAHNREFERTFYGGKAGRAALDAAGIETIGMRPLRDLLRSTPANA